MAKPWMRTDQRLPRTYRLSPLTVKRLDWLSFDLRMSKWALVDQLLIHALNRVDAGQFQPGRWERD